KSRIGANSILSISLAFARARALDRGISLYDYFAKLIDSSRGAMPKLMVNLFSGGAHAGQQVAIQDCLILPQCADIGLALSTTYEVYQKSAQIIRERYGMRALTADEGGLAPDFASEEEMMTCAMEAIQQLRTDSGTDVALALDVAASQFYKNGFYQLSTGDLTGKEFSKTMTTWLSKYPILSIEDCFAEEDWGHWITFNASVGKNVAIVGDDLLCTNPDRIRYAIEHKAANSLLLKVNQIGTLYEAAKALQLVRSADWTCVISARSGETEDNWLADLAVGWSADYIKVGSITQSERLSKYNRLLEIEKETSLKSIG
ncbi:MAG: phosphopyruvate hydratase, partial [Bacteroidetes bacterium]